MKGIAEPEREDASSDDEKLTVSNDRNLTRQKLKQIDRRQITQMPRATIDQYVEATKAEHDNWMSWGGVRPTSHREAKKILGDPKLAKRVLKSRAAYRDKNRGVGEIKAKCRVVLVGGADPDLFRLSRDSPTPTRLSEALILCIAAAGANSTVGHDKGTWKL